MSVAPKDALAGGPVVAVVGAGLIGRAWAVAFACGGCAVRLWDPVEGVAATSAAAVPAMLEALAANGLLDEPPAAVAARVAAVEGLAAALAGAAHVQESAPEQLALKRALFAELDQLAAPETTLASSTSALLPSAFTDHLPGRARCLVAHPINPPSLIRAVEIVPAPWTDPAVVARAAALMRAIGRKPIRMTREIDGFLMNRLQGALLQEAFRLVAEGYASPEDVDIGVAEGLAPRWAVIGPFETIDLNAPGGVRDYVARYGPMYRLIAERQRKEADWDGPALDRIEAARRAALPLEDLRLRQDWRDRRLMAQAAAKRRADREIGE